MKTTTSLAILTGLIAVVFLIAAIGPGCSEPDFQARATLWQEVFPEASGLRQQPLDEKEAPKTRLYLIDGPEGVIGYLVEKQVKGRSGVFSIAVYIGADLYVQRAVVTNYPHRRGRAVKSPEFTGQFQGKGPDDPISLDQDIDAMTGATISSSAMAQGVRDALQLLRQKEP